MKSLHLLALALTPVATAVAAPDYAIVVSEKTQQDAGWKPVIAKLQERHPAHVVVTWSTDPGETREELAKHPLHHICFVAQPTEAGADFVGKVHRLCRALDEDPYPDALWGILTGFDAPNALAIASENTPLIVRKVGSGTDVELDRCEEGTWYCELRQGHSMRKDKDGQPALQKGPADSTLALANLLTDYQADLFVTSGHATERDWQIGFRYANGSFRSKAGQLMGVDTQGNQFEINSTHPRIYMPIGNCLMGHIDGPDAMALAWMKSAGVRQMLGYVKPTWYGYQGWGCLDYFIEQPGRFSLCEAFFANQCALIHRLRTYFPDALKVGETDDRGRPLDKSLKFALTDAAKAAGLGGADLTGLLFDRDVVAFYGDPAWEARMAEGKLSWKQEFSLTDNGSGKLTITPLLGEASFATVNNNGSQRGGRPIVHFFPHRIDPTKVKITSGADRKLVITENFLLIPLPEKAEVFTVEFGPSTGKDSP